MKAMEKKKIELPTSWRTSDMALVAYLATIGRKHDHLELDDNPVSCYWVFEETEDIPDLVFDYLEGKGLVEPKGFNTIMGQLKNSMFEFLRGEGIATPNRR